MNNNNANVSPRDRDTKTGVGWHHISPVLKWTLVCALGFYGALLLEPGTQHWIMAHQFDAVRAIGKVAAEHAMSLLWISATVVSAFALREMQRATAPNHHRRTARTLRAVRARLSRTARLVGGAA